MPSASRYQLVQPPWLHTARRRRRWMPSLKRRSAGALTSIVSAFSRASSRRQLSTCRTWHSIMKTAESCPSLVFGPSSKKKSGNPGELLSRLLARLRLAGLARRLPSALGGRPELADAVLDAAGQHVQVGVRGKVTGDAERDLAAVGEDGDPGPDRRRDRHVRNGLQELASGTVKRHLGAWHV